MKRLTLLGALLALFALVFATAVACGGDDDDDGGNGDAGGGDATQPAGGNDDHGDDGDEGDSGDDGDDNGDEGDDGDDDGGGFGFGTGMASVTIGDTVYEFDLTAEFVVCHELFGIIQADGPGADGADTSVHIQLPPTDWESYTDGRYDTSRPEVEVSDDENGIFWKAGYDDIYQMPEEAVIHSYEIDGLQARGTATFVNLTKLGFDGSGEVETAEGSFEVACEED